MRLPVVATNNVHYATPQKAPLAEAIAAVRAVRSMDELDGWMPAHGGAHLRSGACGKSLAEGSPPFSMPGVPRGNRRSQSPAREQCDRAAR